MAPNRYIANDGSIKLDTPAFGSDFIPFQHKRFMPATSDNIYHASEALIDSHHASMGWTGRLPDDYEESNP
jgi:hypothetical protein